MYLFDPLGCVLMGFPPIGDFVKRDRCPRCRSAKMLVFCSSLFDHLVSDPNDSPKPLGLARAFLFSLSSPIR